MRIEQKLSYPIFFIILGNILTGIIKNKDLIYYLSYVGIFIILISLLIFRIVKLKDSTVSLMLLLFSCIALFQEDITALNDVTFLILSLFITVKSKKIYLIYGAVYSVLLLTRYTLTDMSPSDIIMHISGISFILILYQHYIHPKKTIKKELELNYINLPVKKSVIDILKLRILGFDWWEINDKLELTCTAKWTNEQVNKEMKLHGFKNRESFIYYLIENGAIKTKKPLSNTD